MNLQQIARDLIGALDEHFWADRSQESRLDVQALCVAEEAGELVGAYRRYAGKARREGTLAEVEDEVADTLITTSILAEMLGIDISKAVESKLATVYSRGWREEDGLE